MKKKKDKRGTVILNVTVDLKFYLHTWNDNFMFTQSSVKHM